MAQKVSRREMLRWSGLAAGAAMIAACTPEVVVETVIQEVEKVVKETVIVDGEERVVEKVVKETVVVEKEAEAVGYQGTIEMFAQAYTPVSADTSADPDAPKRQVLDQLAAVWNTAHPGATVEFVPSPPGSYTDWLTTQTVGGTGPDIFFLWLGSLHAWADDGRVVVLNDYLNMPNKYRRDDLPWKETFLDPFVEEYSMQGNYGGVPVDLVSTGLYTNHDLLVEAGIDFEGELNTELGSPDNWEVFMEWMAKLQAVNTIPMAMGGSSIDWFWRTLADMLAWNWLDELDVLNYHDSLPVWRQEGFVSQEEMHHGWWCLDWNPWERPEVLEKYRIFKEWSQYFQDGWTARDGQTAYDMFATGQAAMLWEGSWQLGPLRDDHRRDFELVSFWIPPITRETSPAAADPPKLPIGVGGWGVAYGLNHVTLQRGNVDECVDWMMFLTTPENNEMMVNEVPSFVPAVVGTRALPEIENLFVGEERLVRGARPNRSLEYIFGYAEGRYNSMWHRENELYFLDSQSLEQTMANMIRISDEAAVQDIRAAAIQYDEEGNWDLTQWDCQPDV